MTIFISLIVVFALGFIWGFGVREMMAKRHTQLVIPRRDRGIQEAL